MRSDNVSGLRTFVAMAAIGAALAYLSIQVPASPDGIQDSEGMSLDPAPSNFIASGGLVPDSAAFDPAGDDPSNHAAVAAPASSAVATF